MTMNLGNARKFNMIFNDITSNCNLRCVFCVNDFSNIKGNILMTEKVFDKVMALLPLVPDGSFFLSCLFEPTMHPDFIDC